MKLLFPIFILLLIVLSSCTKDKAKEIVPEPSPPDPLSFCDSLEFNNGHTHTAAVKRIFDTNCATVNCHDPLTAEQGIILDTYSRVVDGMNNKSVWCSINHNTGCTPMPEAVPKLSTTTIDTLKCWLDKNMPE